VTIPRYDHKRTTLSEETPQQTPEPKAEEKSKQSAWAVPMIIVVVLGVALAVFYMREPEKAPAPSSPPTTQVGPGAGTAPAVRNPATVPPGETGAMQVAQAVMVTANLSFPERLPSIAEALSQIERRYEPQDGHGRTFAVLDAYGEPTPDGKLHISMHVSSEKPGVGSLVFKPTGEVLWRSKISGQPVSATKNLNIYVGDDAGGSWIIDGSGNPASILDAKVRDKNQAVRNFWPDGAEREMTFVYSACGYPVKAMVKRVGDRTVRTKELPVLFPDDPAAVQVISRLMGWQS